MSKRNAAHGHTQPAQTQAGSQDPRANEQADTAKDDEEKNPLAEVPLPEWIVAAIGLLLVVGVIGFLVYYAVAGDTSPPNLMARVDSVQVSQDGFLATIRVLNQGGQTAAGVVVEAELVDGDESLETSQLTLSYVPAHSERLGGVFFTHDPRQYELRLRTLGYETP